MVNVPNQKLFITGKDSILRYMLACTPSQETKTSDGKKPKKNASAAIAVPGKGAVGDIFNQPLLLTEPSLSAEEDGMCKQGEICK
jgi:hypothetical protein